MILMVSGCCCCASKLDFRMKKDGNTVENKADVVFTSKSNYSDLFGGHAKPEQLQERDPSLLCSPSRRIDVCD